MPNINTVSDALQELKTNFDHAQVAGKISQATQFDPGRAKLVTTKRPAPTPNDGSEPLPWYRLIYMTAGGSRDRRVTPSCHFRPVV